jgi:L-iditol 2-dehydrogenase
MAWDSSCLFELPDSINDEEGVMLEPLGVAIHAIDLAKLKIGMSVGVFGCGPLGLLIIQLARLAGVKQIIATDPLPHRVKAAKKAGADHAILVSDSTNLPELLDLTDGRGVDVTFDVSGSPDAVNTAFHLVIPGGKVILVGIPDEDQTSFCASLARRKGLTIKLVRRMKFTYPRAMHLISKNLVDVKSIISHHFPLEQGTLAFQTAARREGLKIIIDL